MRKFVGYALIAIALLTLIIWGISRFIQPILPTNFNNNCIFFIALLAGVMGFFAAFKDVIELFRSLFDKHDNNAPSGLWLK